LAGALFRVAVAAGLVYAAGFGIFLLTLPEPNAIDPDTVSADAIVALTGQDRRLAAAIDLLERGAGKRLLISGVNPSTTKSELRELLAAGPTFDCCADLGFTALDTRGNAQETADWAAAHGYKSIILVTGYDHMPRSLLEFAAEMPDVALVPYPVGRPEESDLTNLRFSRLNSEYAKYLASWVRLSLSPRAAAATS
jgi:uncharacterized SAM-binding protein YcdF (DUF218 family)